MKLVLPPGAPDAGAPSGYGVAITVLLKKLDRKANCDGRNTMLSATPRATFIVISCVRLSVRTLPACQRLTAEGNSEMTTHAGGVRTRDNESQSLRHPETEPPRSAGQS